MKLVKTMGFQCPCGLQVKIYAIALTAEDEVILCSHCETCGMNNGVTIQDAIDGLAGGNSAQGN